MPKKKLNLLQFAASGAAKPSAASTKIVRRKFAHANLGGELLDDVPDQLFRHSFAPNLAGTAHTAKETTGNGPSVLAKELGVYDAVNVGAAGTLVIRKPGLRAKFLAELRRKLPFEATIAFCDGSDLIRLEMDNPFGTEPPRRKAGCIRNGGFRAAQP